MPERGGNGDGGSPDSSFLPLSSSDSISPPTLLGSAGMEEKVGALAEAMGCHVEVIVPQVEVQTTRLRRWDSGDSALG